MRRGDEDDEPADALGLLCILAAEMPCTSRTEAGMNDGVAVAAPPPPAPAAAVEVLLVLLR